MSVYEVENVAVWDCPAEGSPLRTDRDAVEMIGEARRHHAGLVVLPVRRLGDTFFQLSTRVAGEVLQKFLVYGLRVAIVGDISRYVAESCALRAFVAESNRGKEIWFLKTRDELEQRLKQEAAPQ